ncbi:GGDEF domain-containing protein [Asticcacaulis sp. AND118]|uniref:GGDEF domain-containing protein n=1 Tax=Asticcacaulis sp. AND118 TaxID=2840468 RepID=UPI001CFF6E5B|nr:GGDEF domain-containing protein [Asticcacaulis sp. AND118]UDF04943.1 GGDEF domain-containing protein [Asticcacaulis sp. AND118]
MPPSASVDPETPASPSGNLTASMQALLQSQFGGGARPVATATLPPPPAATDAAPGDEWPFAARALIDSLIRENIRLKADIKALSEQVALAEHHADHDVLTPTLNRRAFLRDLGRAMGDSRRYGDPACLVYLDLDGFKSINDTYGHAAGDKALIHIAEMLNANVREGDSVGRLGGDEFAILLRHADVSVARIKAQKLEAELNIGTFEHQGLYLRVGGSFGVRAYDGQASAEEWIAEADAAMFMVKKSSR